MLTETNTGRRRGVGRLAKAAQLAVALVAAACGGDSETGPGTVARPSTDARLQILEPAPNQMTGPDVTLRVDLMGARVVEANQGELVPDQGHIHVTLDGKLVSLYSGTTQELKGLAPGPHSVQAEFVAIDHAPFTNRVIAAVLFTVGP